MYEINKRIRDEMQKQNLTMTELAKKSGLNRSTISRYVNDAIEPKQNAIGAIADALGVSPAYLLGFDISEDAREIIDLAKLNDKNLARLLAYYEALIDSQKD